MFARAVAAARGTRRGKILTREAFENAITVVYALGGSTNAVLHLLAIAHEAGVPLAIDDFNRVGGRVPLLAALSPHGRYQVISISFPFEFQLNTN